MCFVCSSGIEWQLHVWWANRGREGERGPHNERISPIVVIVIVIVDGGSNYVVDRFSNVSRRRCRSLSPRAARSPARPVARLTAQRGVWWTTQGSGAFSGLHGAFFARPLPHISVLSLSLNCARDGRAAADAAAAAGGRVSLQVAYFYCRHNCSN